MERKSILFHLCITVCLTWDVASLALLPFASYLLLIVILEISTRIFMNFYEELYMRGCMQRPEVNLRCLPSLLKEFLIGLRPVNLA